MSEKGMTIFRRVSLLTLAVICSGATAYFTHRANIDKNSAKNLNIDLSDAKSKIVTVVKNDEGFKAYKEGCIENIQWRYANGVYDKEHFDTQMKSVESDEFCIEYATNSDNKKLQAMSIDVEIIETKKSIAETEAMNDNLKLTSAGMGAAIAALAFIKGEEEEQKRKEDKENRKLKQYYEMKEAGYIPEDQTIDSFLAK